MKLSDIQTDILKEIGNIGAGRAANTLSKFLHQEVSMSLPYISRVKGVDGLLGKVIEDFELKGEEFALTFNTVDQSQDYLLFCLMPKSSCEELIKISFDEENIYENDLMVQSLLREVGNILLITYVDALNKFISMDLMAVPGNLEIGPIGQLIDSYKTKISELEGYDASDDNTHLLIDLSIFAVDQKISAYLGFIPQNKTISEISESLLGHS